MREFQKLFKKSDEATQPLLQSLLLEGKEAMKKWNVTKLEHGEFPANEPYIVLYSADWCLPCVQMKPTFAALSQYFTQAPLFYVDCSDKENEYSKKLVEEDHVQCIPRLVAHINNKKIQSSTCSSATELWEMMNALIEVGSMYHSKADICSIHSKGTLFVIKDEPYKGG